MKHSIKQWLYHLRKMAEVIRDEIRILFDVIPWDDDDNLPPKGCA